MYTVHSYFVKSNVFSEGIILIVKKKRITLALVIKIAMIQYRLLISGYQ